MKLSPPLEQSPEQTVLDKEVRLYVKKRAAYEELVAKMEEAKKEYDGQKDRLWDVLEANSTKTLNHELGRFTRGTNVRGLVTSETALEQSLDDMGMLKGMRKLTWRQRELNALAKERMDGDMPDGLEPFVQKKLTYTPKRPAADAIRLDRND